MGGGGDELLVAASENCVHVGNCLRRGQVNGVVAAELLLFGQGARSSDQSVGDLDVIDLGTEVVKQRNRGSKPSSG